MVEQQKLEPRCNRGRLGGHRRTSRRYTVFVLGRRIYAIDTDRTHAPGSIEVDPGETTLSIAPVLVMDIPGNKASRSDCGISLHASGRPALAGESAF